MPGRTSSRPGSALRRIARPRSWPVRWRLAAVSSGLTFLILLIFGGVIGQIATQRIRDDFNNEVRSSVQILAGQVRIVNPLFGESQAELPQGQLNAFTLSDDASARIFDARGRLISQNEGAEPLGPPSAGLSDYRGKRVATEKVINENGELTGFVQYGRSLEHIESTIGRVWFLIFAGIAGGTLLASLAGIAIASRAMRPISSLTATAREVAMTRDPSQRIPRPPVEDEVGELADTLDLMLRSLDQARTEREATMQRQREFVADASHELRTPLTSVLANLELLQDSLQADQREEREMVDSALRSSKRMNRLVGDLLLLARADAGRLGKHRACDLAEVAGDAAVEASALLGERELTISNARPLVVQGNPDELHRLILNLLDNAAHHTPPDSRVELALRAESGDAVIEIGDDGPGIPPEAREKVFQRFVRGTGPADTQAGTGTGLGLAIVAAVAASHGGSVEVTESKLGGALFRARIPLAAADEEPASDRDSKPLEAL